MTKDLEYVELYPKIIVYKNMFNDVDEFLKQSLNSKPWHNWYVFGEMLALEEHSLNFDKFPTKEEFYSARVILSKTENDINRYNNTKEMGEIFYQVTSHFVKLYNIEAPNWYKEPSSVNRYFADQGISDDYAMSFHTDFVIPERDMAGYKFVISTTAYLNDDYEDGEICFIVDNNYISYKPEKGDVIVFPSVPPFYHGVRKAKGSDRFMVRGFWKYYSEASKEWLDNQKLYGKEKWSEMEKQRLDTERHENIYHDVQEEKYEDFFRLGVK